MTDLALTHGEERFHLLVDSVRDYAIFMLDPGGHVATWNPGAERIKGYTEQEIVGQHFSRFYPPEDIAAGIPERVLDRARQEGSSHIEGWRVRKDGTRFWGEVTVTAIRQDGHLLGFAKVTRDLTERHATDEALRQSEERFRIFVENVVDYAIYVLDPLGYVTTWNAGAQRLKQYSADEIIGQHFSRFYPPEDVAAGKPQRLLNEALRDGRVEEENWRLRKDGSPFWANVVITALRDPDGTLVGFAKVTRDLTGRRQLELERLRLAKAEEAIRLRDEFLSLAAHELKTPMTVLQLQLDTLQDRMQASDQWMAVRLARATQSSERLAGLIESLMDVSRIATGRFAIEPQSFDIVECVARVVDTLRESADRARCALIFEETGGPIHGSWDRLRVEQVVTNLLVNAIKYGAGHPVHVVVKSSPGEDAADPGSIALDVRDHGPGIPTGEMARIFGRFERASSTRNYGGLGLGLYVIQEIVSAHGGTVSAENVADGGARFTIRLPLRAGAAVPAEAARASDVN